jgi:hypothetical protein
MPRFRHLPIVALTVAIVGLFLAGKANAQNLYAGRIINNSGMTVAYQWRVNNEPWKNAQLAPGQQKVWRVTRAYLLRNREGYQVQVRYDALVGPGQNWQTKILAMRWCNADINGFPNTFRRFSPYGTYTYLFLGL